MQISISENKYRPQPPTREEWMKYTDYKKKIEELELRRKEKDRLIDEYLREHKL